MSELQTTPLIATPPAPPAGFISMYSKTNGLWYSQNSAGVESPLASGIGSLNLDGGMASTVYLLNQTIDGGGA